MEVLIFEIGSERYALPLGNVREIVRAVAITRLPKAPAVVEGVVNVRGQIVPVLDIRQRFGLPRREAAPADHLVIARAGERTVALRADRVTRLAHVDAADIQRADELVPHAGYIAGVAKLPEGIALIHDLKTFLSKAESASLDGALASREAAIGGR